MGGSVSTASASVATTSSDGGLASSNPSPDVRSASSTVDGSRLSRPILLSVGGGSPVVVRPGADNRPIVNETQATATNRATAAPEAQKAMAVPADPPSTGAHASERAPPPPHTEPRDVSLVIAGTSVPQQGSSMAAPPNLASSFARSKSSSSCASASLRAPTFALDVVPPALPLPPRSAASSLDARTNERLRVGSSSRRPDTFTALSDGSVLSVGDSVRLVDALMDSSSSVQISQAAVATNKDASGVVFVLACDAAEADLEDEPFDAVGFLPETEQGYSGSRRRGQRIGTQREVLVGGLFDESFLQGAARREVDPSGESSLCDEDDDRVDHGASPLDVQHRMERPTRKSSSASVTPNSS